MTKAMHTVWGAACVLIAVTAFFAGRLAVALPGGKVPAEVSAQEQAGPTDSEDTQDPGEQILTLQRKLTDAEERSVRLQKEKSDLQAKLADLEQAYRTSQATLNDLRHRAEELEWQAKGGGASTSQ